MDKTIQVAGGRHKWMFSLLERSGAELTKNGDGVFTYQLTGHLAEYLEREQLSFTFRKRLAVGEDVELASAGSWLHDQLLRFARSRGRLARLYLPAQSDLPREEVLRTRRPGFVGMDKMMGERYGTQFQYTFRLAFYSEPPVEHVLQVIFDCERKKILKRPLNDKVLQTAVESAPEDWPTGKALRPKKYFPAVWATLEEWVESKVETIGREGRPQLEKELATVERYYRQLIAEEKRLLKTRPSRKGQEESTEKIGLLKLEWERRVTEETERLRPQVVATLSTIALIHYPIERWSCSLKSNSKIVVRQLDLDLARGESWEAAPARR